MSGLSASNVDGPKITHCLLIRFSKLTGQQRTSGSRQALHTFQKYVRLTIRHTNHYMTSAIPYLASIKQL